MLLLVSVHLGCPGKKAIKRAVVWKETLVSMLTPDPQK